MCNSKTCFNIFFFIFRYYSGEKQAPVLTIFIGGNHEASNYLQELAYGGWVAPNIYYLGYAGVIKVGGLRIGGISGIFRDYHYEKGHFEFPPYDEGTKRSVYAIRNLEVFRLSQLSPEFDIMISHDWPTNIWNFGNKEQLLRFKPYFREDIESGKMGSQPSWDLLGHLQPKYWYSAHMHCRFDATVKFSESKLTQFVALDKCLPKRRFLDFITIGDALTEEPQVEYDLEWLTVLSITNNFLNVTTNYTKLPYAPEPEDPQDNHQRWDFRPTEQEMEAVLKKFNGNLKIPNNFKQTVEAYQPEIDGRNFRNIQDQIFVTLNPQTTDFCQKLGIDDPLFLCLHNAGKEAFTSTKDLSSHKNIDELLEDNQKTVIEEEITRRAPLASFLPTPKFNEEAIDLDEFDNDDNDEHQEQETERTLDESEKPQIEKLPEETASILSETNTQIPIETPPIKKFKRRNEAIYTADDD